MFIVSCAVGWFKASGFWYTTDTRPSLKILSDSVLLPRVMGIPVAMVLLDQFLHVLQQVTDGVEVGVCQLKALGVCLGGS